MPGTVACIHHGVLPYERSHIVSAAQSILDQGGWCVVEVCMDVPGQR